jgi:alpha-glucosidase
MPVTRPKFFVALCLVFLFPAIALSQALARPGWAGFVSPSEAWWKGSSVYEIDPHGFGSLDEITQHLDYIHSLGADAILLTHFQPDAAHPQSVDPALGTLDNLDDLIHQASTRNMRILIDLGQLAPATDLNSIARYWLNQGIAGFHIEGSQQADQLRKISSSYIGQRIVIGDVDPSAAIDHQGPQLLLDTRLSKVTQLAAAALRPEIEAVQPTQNMLLATDTPNDIRSITRLGDGQHDVDIAKILATILFANHASALIYYGQEIGLPSSKSGTSEASLMKWGVAPPPLSAKTRRPLHPAPPVDPTTVEAQESNSSSLLSWYRRLIALHHSNATINSGPTTIVLNHDDQNVLAWIRKPQAVTYKNPPVVIVCNLTARPVHLSLKEDMQKQHLKGNFLRTILRSDEGMGPMTLDNMTLPPFGVYIGGLGY